MEISSDLNIPCSDHPRIVVIGGGFAGLKLILKLRKKPFQLVLVDKHNYHQFQPLLYQVATAGLEPSSISFPFRKIFQKASNIFFRHVEVLSVNTEAKQVVTSQGVLSYDMLVVATGTVTNFFGNEQIKKNALIMKSVPDSLFIRNQLLRNFELAETCQDNEERKRLLSIVIVGGGPTGVELAGTLAEMRKLILPKDYPDMDISVMRIFLLENSSRLLSSFDERSSKKAKQYLEKLGVEVSLTTKVASFNGSEVEVQGKESISTYNFLWTAGVCGRIPAGFKEESLGRGNRLLVNSYNEVQGYSDVFALGDVSLVVDSKEYPNGHPQLAQVAIQQATRLADNLVRKRKAKPLVAFSYKNKGIMATVGRNLAVVELGKLKFYGFVAWLLWMFVHLMAILGIKNRLFIFISWTYGYFTFDQSLRMIIKQDREVS